MLTLIDVRAVFAAALAVSVALTGWAADKTRVGGTS